MKLIAHRGMGAKENTIAAFKNAILNKDTVGFECDIRLSKDNKIVVIHDPFIERVTDGNGIVKYKTSKQLAKYNIPKLSNVLKLKTDKIILIEVKDTSIPVDELIALLHKYPKKNIYLASFHGDYLHEILKRKPKFKVGLFHNFINNEKSYDEYDFIGLLSLVPTNIIKKHLKNNLEVFLYGILVQPEKYRDDVYLIVDL